MTSYPHTGYSDYTLFEKYINGAGEDGLFTEEDSEQYPSWCVLNGALVEYTEIQSIFEELGHVFAFQQDNVRNMLDFFMIQLDSRSSRMHCSQALLSLHADYIGGEHSNYRKWYFATQYYVPKKKSESELNDIANNDSHEVSWKKKMVSLSEKDYVTQVALYLLIWGEASNVRFLPECICFIYKCALDYLHDEGGKEGKKGIQTSFLEQVITPIYAYMATQIAKRLRGKDHPDVVGYDDMNQLFWYPQGLQRIKLLDGTRLMDLPPGQRFQYFQDIQWKKAFYKTFKEHRTWLHLITNFNRVWIIHASVYWYYISFNSLSIYTKDYIQVLDNKPPPQVRWTVVSFGSSIACMIQILATVLEWIFVPRKWPGARLQLPRLLLLIFLFLVNVSPSVYILSFIPLDAYSRHAFIISMVQFPISVITTLYLSIVPSNKLFYWRSDYNNKVFNASFPKLSKSSRFISVGLWFSIFAAKFVESYFFLILSLKDPIRILSTMKMSRCYGDKVFGSILCNQQARITLLLMYLADFVLFFLDTYLWYVICNCILSIGLSFSLGVSIFTPWRNIYNRLPERLATKILFTTKKINNPTLFVSQIWNGIILSMYREHILTIDQVKKLVYQKFQTDLFGGSVIRAPSFFVHQDDSTNTMSDFFIPGLEAERRISFFAQSLSTPIPEPIPTIAMPTFTVLIPHYSEKIILSLKEILKEDKRSKVSLLEYLKTLNPVDWENYVKDTKILSSVTKDDNIILNGDQHFNNSLPDLGDILLNDRIDDLPYYCVGFKSSSPESTLRTRIWASLRTQTLYRTVSGFMNYQKAIKLLHYSETIEMVQSIENGNLFDNLANRKFHLVIAMQRFLKFSEDERRDADLLFATYPDVKVACIDEIIDEDGTVSYYSTLLDVSLKGENGEYNKIYSIKLAGNPILGDGKSDNQNCALIFYRGEYIQVIDANQDNYIEECLKIKSVLAEFEEYELDCSDQYNPQYLYSNENRVAILGAREYIFSENIGVLGDIAAGKEQTFGTLFARTLAKIGGKLHYGHPDFINGIFMATRGGISKGQKGLHLNEDIYAGITAITRGGKIKHCDYYQCGKGRDLGFGTILNFTTKIGAGMGEQILSREHYYLGTQLPIDRFLSFYYAHPGFHLNNLFIMLSVELFMLILVNLGSLSHESIFCMWDKHRNITDIEEPLGCYNLKPVLDWVNRYVFSVVICFALSFLPLVFQESIEKGPIKALSRVCLHIISLAPFFEVFVCKVYAKSLRDNITFSGARYIATGRGFATSRISFSVLYSRYATTSIYSGLVVFFVVLFGTVCMWQPSLLWFWISVISLTSAPFIFNPHQFAWGEFVLDYRDFLRWLSRGNSKTHRNSWIGFTRARRSKFTGYKRKSLSADIVDEKDCNVNRPSRWNLFIDEVLLPFTNSTFLLIPFMFINSQNGVSKPSEVNILLRLVIVSIIPWVLNTIVLIVLLPISLSVGPLTSCCCRHVSSVMAAIAHTVAILFTILTFIVFFILEGGNLTRTLCGIICVLSFQRSFLLFVSAIILSKELKEDYTNRAWWSGNWIFSGLGWMAISQFLREFIVKTFEMSLFAYDFILGHCLLFSMVPILMIPYIDKWHSCMLFWLGPRHKFQSHIRSKREMRRRKRIITKYSILFFMLMAIFAAIVVIPIISSNKINEITKPWISHSIVPHLFQPNGQNNNDTGINAPQSVLREKPEPRTMRTVF